jgi:hypothetical protein
MKPQLGGTMISYRRLARIINRNFSYPFLPEGHVKAENKKGVFYLQIGRRDIGIEKEEVVGSGTFLKLNTAIRLKIQKGGLKP